MQPPVTAGMLAPLAPECRWVSVGGRLSDSEFARLAEIMGSRPEVSLSVDFCHDDDGIRDLDFLRFFAWLERLLVFSSLVGDLSGLSCLTDLQDLHIETGRRRRSAAQVAAVAGTLRHLSLEGPVSGVDALSELTGLRTLTLRSVTMPDLSPLTPMTDLRALELRLNGTRDLTLLPAFTRLQYFEACLVRGLTDVTAIGEVSSLEELRLDALRNVTVLPPLHQLTRLRRIHLNTMKGLHDLSVLMTAPALEEIDLCSMGHLDPAQVTQLAAHPALRKASIGLGSDRKNKAAALPFPFIDTPSLQFALEAYRDPR